jgi:hypothetical protein
MDLDVAHLSSLSSSLRELTERVTALAEGLQGSPRANVAADLFDVERSLKAASRRLAALVAKLD